MPKRFSGELRLTVTKRECFDDEYEIRAKAPGCSPLDAISALQEGYTSLNGIDSAIDEAALMFLRMAENDFPNIAARAAKKKKKKGFHVGRSMAERWPGGLSNTKTKRGR